MELGNLKNLPLEMIVNVSKELEKKATFLPEPKEFSRGGGKKIADILNQMSESEATDYLNQLMTDDPETYAEVRKYLLTFDDLLAMSDDIASDFWSNPDIDIDVLAKALKGVDSEQTNSVIELLPKRKQAMFTPIDKPISKKDIRFARSQIVQMARAKIADGNMSMDEIFGQEELE